MALNIIIIKEWFTFLAEVRLSYDDDDKDKQRKSSKSSSSEALFPWLGDSALKQKRN